MVDEPARVDKRGAGVRDFDSVVKYLHLGPAAEAEILINEGIGNQFAECRFRVEWWGRFA